ncbi:hypothetical protein WUBG_15503, partial [Wuchereria bancrofti]
METRSGKGLKGTSKEGGLPDFIEIREESEDDGPVEVSSKVQCQMPVAGNTSK